ncbi:MAG: hydrogenase maturation nickel metallochaperone HypA [Candidatus Omnitrophota bacterium]
MHEISLIQNMLKIVEDVARDNGAKPVEAITVELSEFGSLDEGHFRFHFDEATKGTAWQGLKLDIQKVPFGQEAKLVSVRFKE